MKDILQLIKKENNQEYKDIYPKTYTDAVLDKHTGANLADILNSFNMYFIAYAGSKEVTRVLVPTNLRRKGLWITYIMLDDTIVTEYYNGSLLTDDAWLNSANWVNSIQPFDKFSKKNMTCRFDNFTDKSTSSKLMTVKQGGEIVFSTTDNRFYYLHRDVLYAYWEVKGKPSNTEFQYKDSVYTDKLFLCKDRAYVMYNGTLVDIARFTIDKELSLTSNNPIANSTVTKKINEVNVDATTALTLARELKEEGRFLINGNVTNNPDEEDITVEENKLKFRDKNYNAGEFSGLGRVYLRKNIVNGKNVLTQEMINKLNTIYIIQYDYDLDNKIIYLQSNCILKFEGGSLNNGIIYGNINSTIIAHPIRIFNNITIKNNMLWNVEYAYSEWFDSIQEALDNFARVKLLSKNYAIDNTINLHIGNELIGSDSTCLLIQNNNMILINIMLESFCKNFTVQYMNTSETLVENCIAFNIDTEYIESKKTDKRFKNVSHNFFMFPAQNIIFSGNRYNKHPSYNIGIKIRCYDGKGYSGAIAKECLFTNGLDYGIYIDTGNKIGFSDNNGWYTNGVLEHCRFNYCKTGIFLTSDNEKENVNVTFNPPQGFEFNNCDFQSYEYDLPEEVDQVLIYVKKAYNIKFNKCIMWDWAVNAELYPDRVPVLVNPNYSKYIEFNECTYIPQKIFKYSEDLKEDRNSTGIISIKNFNNELINLSYYIDSNTKTPKYDLYNLAQSKYIFNIKKYKDVFNIKETFNSSTAVGILHNYKFNYSSYIIIDLFDIYNNNINYKAIRYSMSLYKIKKEDKIYEFDWHKTAYLTTDNFPMGNTYIDENGELVIIKSNNQQFYYDGVLKDTKRLGNTAQRPINVKKGYNYFDIDLNKNIQWDGSKWIDLNGNIADSIKKGTTAQRPTGVQIGFTYKDTDLNKWIIWNGEAWENIDGTALG